MFISEKHQDVLESKVLIVLKRGNDLNMFSYINFKMALILT